MIKNMADKISFVRYRSNTYMYYNLRVVFVKYPYI